MRKLIALLTVLLITGVLALGQNAKPLSDKQMDTITAGDPGGNGNNGDDQIGTSAVTISGGVLSGVTTTNLVVSADSAVASGINVFSGNTNPTPTSPTPTSPASTSHGSANTSGTSPKPIEPINKGNGGNGNGGNDGKDGGGDDGNKGNHDQDHGGLNQTNNISVDRDSGKGATNSSVTLTDNAESGITAVNIVNAASSSVATGINVAQSNAINTTSFNQINNVSAKH